MGMRKHEGIQVRHQVTCAQRQGGACNCEPSYQAEAFDKRTGKKLRRTFPTVAAAKSWRIDQQKAIRSGVRRGPSGVTVADAALEWLAAAESGAIVAKTKLPYKPSTLRGYRASIEQHLIPGLGKWKLDALSPVEVQFFVDRLAASGMSPTAVRGAVMPLRVIYRHACRRGLVSQNPVTGVEMQAWTTQRDRVADQTEVARLLAVLPERDRPIWGVALYAGLRLGEIQALRHCSIDLQSGVIHVTQSWDRRSRTFVAPKSRAGNRRVPIPEALATYLAECIGGPGDEQSLVFQNRRGEPFSAEAARVRAKKAWSVAGLEPIGFHECRHTYASLMLAAGVPLKPLAVFMGHSNISVTVDRYGHLMPGSEAEAARLLDDYVRKGRGS